MSDVAHATTNSNIDDEIDVTGTDSESDNGTESDISINGESYADDILIGNLLSG